MPNLEGITKVSNILIETLLILLIIFSPLLYGSVGILSYTIVELAVFFMVALWFLKMANAGNISFIKTFLFLPALLFILVIILQMVSLPKEVLNFFSPNSIIFYKDFLPTEIFKKTYLSLSIYREATFLELFKVLSYLAIFFLILNNIESKGQFQRIFNIIIFFGLGISLFAIIQRYTYAHLKKVYWFDAAGSAGYPFGPFANRNHFAGYIEMVIPLAIGHLITDIELPKKMFYGLAVCVMSLALFLSFSRAGIIVYAASLLFMVLFLGFRKPLRKKLVAILILFLIVLFASMFLLEVNIIAKRFITTFQAHKELAALGRGYLWHDIMKLWFDSPILGTGFGTFGSISPKYKSVPLQIKFTYAHNDYLQLLSETGIAGFSIVFIFFALYFYSLLKMWFKRRDVQVVGLVLGGMTAIWAMLLHSTVDFNLHIPSNALLFFIIMSLTYRLAFTPFRDSSLTGLSGFREHNVIPE